MPKISYLDILDNGADYTEVTASHIEQKIADIEALLRGMIDEDNLLGKDDGSGIVPVSPSNVVDMPVETRPVQHCMKLFGNENGVDSIKEKLFDEVLYYLDKNLKVSLIGGLFDKEIYFELTSTEEADAHERKSIILELPPNWTPITAKELWDLITINGYLNVDVLDYSIENTIATGVIVKTFALSDVDRFAKQVLYCKDSSDFVYEAGYNVQKGSSRLKPNSPSYNLTQNSIEVSASYMAWGDGVYMARYYVSALCRVNP